MLDAHVVKLFEAKIGYSRLIITGLPAVALVAPDAALLRPLEYGTVANFYKVWILLQEAVKPLEGAFIGKSHRHEDLPLAQRLTCSDLSVRRGGSLDHSAGERQRSKWIRAKIDVQRHAPVVERGVQRLALQALGQRLRLANPHSVAPEAHRVCIRTLRVEVQDEAVDLACLKLRPDLVPCTARNKVALRIEAEAIVLTYKQRRARRGEAQAQQLPRLWLVALAPALRGS
mmetsp:Transcript_156902/g.273107  ORF Transcript_156902/g.273107 Transcript_156902/m.273107 type:complete len:230 (+) Transcript_156902:2163-2852(+)